MCGITGIVANNITGHKAALSNMMQAIKHRGPDGSGSYMFSNCALGHLRLSIIDLTSGDQPMLASNDNVAITFNGEIYGFNVIKKTITDYDFKTTSDTEVILALYQKHGEELLDKLPGMFSFAIWDNTKQELFCARDRFGEKPFYYAIGDKGEFLFASEIKAILASGLVTPKLSPGAVAHYMKHLYVHPEQTIYSNIYVLPPANKLVFANGNIKVEKYWNLPQANQAISIGDAIPEFKRLLNNAVEKQLVSDVPIGAFLSGGLDSSTIVAVASQFKSNIRTFSFAFEDGNNELPYAKLIADRYNTDHVELTDKKEDIGELLILMQSIYDEPFADSSNIPTYLISKYASEQLKVVLTGDGGDELLAGYSWYRTLMDMPDISSKSQLRKVYLKMMVNYVGKMSPRINRHYADEIQSIDIMRGKDYYAKSHMGSNVYYSDKELSELGLKPYAASLVNLESYNSNSVDDAMRMDIESYMPGDILVKTDRASMANGFELRSPFLDIDFASFCISLPYTMKIDTHTDKVILKQAFADMLPDEIKNRSKQGFGAPVNKWLQLDTVKALKQKYLCDKGQKIFQILLFDKVQEIIQKDQYKTWILLVLAIWMEKHEFVIA